MNNTDTETFDEKMTRYAIYYVIIGGAVLLSGYLQVFIFHTVSTTNKTDHHESRPGEVYLI